MMELQALIERLEDVQYSMQLFEEYPEQVLNPDGFYERLQNQQYQLLRSIQEKYPEYLI